MIKSAISVELAELDAVREQPREAVSPEHVEDLE
jgi:hypothetical protein